MGDQILKNSQLPIERFIRQEAAKEFRRFKLIPKMIYRIKGLLHVNDGGGNP